jgi:hypothetical protein
MMCDKILFIGPHEVIVYEPASIERGS